MIKGRCLCGKVRFSYDGVIEEVALCHCAQCRKAQGGAFAANSPLDNNKLTFEGAEFVNEFETTGDKIRAFCGNCGSAVYSARTSLPDIKRIRIGTIETDFTCENKYHIYTDSKASWHTITDSYHQFKAEKPALENGSSK